VSLWKNLGRSMEIARPQAEAHTQEAAANAGEYQLLYQYLRDRYANRVVLTFGEIEDLLGFALPEPARRQRGWWAVTDQIAPRTAQSDAWMLASRTATVDLLAQRVVFDRKTSRDSSSRGR
jgi:hypothetical protein